MTKCNMIRAFDIIFSAIALLLLAPMFALVAVVLRLTGEGEILYFQTRVGKNGAAFNIIKFATMKKIINTSKNNKNNLIMQMGVAACILLFFFFLDLIILI